MADPLATARLDQEALLPNIVAGAAMKAELLAGSNLCTMTTSELGATGLVQYDTGNMIVLQKDIKTYPGTNIPRISSSPTTKSITLADYAIEYILRYKEMDELRRAAQITAGMSDAIKIVFSEQSNIAVEWLISQLEISKEFLRAQVALNPATYPDPLQNFTPSGSWALTATDIPVDLRNMNDRYENLFGRPPNALFMSKDVYRAIMNNDKMKEIYSAPTQPGPITKANIADVAEIDVNNLFVGIGSYKEDEIGVPIKFWTNYIVFFNKPTGGSKIQQYFLYDIQKTEYPKMRMYQELQSQDEIWQRLDSFTIAAGDTPCAVKSNPIL